MVDWTRTSAAAAATTTTTTASSSFPTTTTPTLLPFPSSLQSPTLSFLAGAVSVSLLWFYQERQRYKYEQRRKQKRALHRQQQLRKRRQRLLQIRKQQQQQRRHEAKVEAYDYFSDYDDEHDDDDDDGHHPNRIQEDDENHEDLMTKEIGYNIRTAPRRSNSWIPSLDTTTTVTAASIEGVSSFLYQSVEDIKSRIGELPASFFKRVQQRAGGKFSSSPSGLTSSSSVSSGRRWPWETMPRSHNSANNSVSTKTKDDLLVVGPSSSSSIGSTEDLDMDPETTSPAGVAYYYSSEDGGGATIIRTKGHSTTTHPSQSPMQQQQQQQQQQPKSGLCIGSIFGLDVGGTLAKLVYFEQKPDTMDIKNFSKRIYNYQKAASALSVSMARKQGHSSTGDIPVPFPRRKSFCTTSESQNDLDRLSAIRQESLPDDLNNFADSIHSTNAPPQFTSVNSMRHILGGETKTTTADPTTTASTSSNSSTTSSAEYFSNLDKHKSLSLSNHNSNNIRKSKSMFNLSKSRDHVQALDRFYSFANRLDSYSEGVKDHKLSFYSRELGGMFHFIRFETRKMFNAMELIRANNLHVNICEMGATGGGAYKYAKDWEIILGIKIKKEEELDSLVAGMQFVLSTVIGECYTFRPIISNKNATAAAAAAAAAVTKQNFGISIDDSDSEDDADAAHGDGFFSTKSVDKDTTANNNNNTNNHNDSADVNDDHHSTASSNSSFSNDEGGGSENGIKIGGRGDEWWWSKKVQRDSVSYSNTYPYLLVTIGTGVSVLRVDGPRKHERISGSTIGGGTYWGLIRLLTDVEDFEDCLKLVERGDPSKVDMMVGDIYGNGDEDSTSGNSVLEKIGLSPKLVASSFGKLVSKENPADGLKQEDIARALLLMVTINIGQVAYLNAKLCNTSRIYFVGNFLRNNKISQRRLSFAIDYWSKGTMEALFLEHEGYFGALGAFLLSSNIINDKDNKKRTDDAAGTDKNSKGKAAKTNKTILKKSSSQKNKPLHKRRNTVGDVVKVTS